MKPKELEIVQRVSTPAHRMAITAAMPGNMYKPHKEVINMLKKSNDGVARKQKELQERLALKVTAALSIDQP